MRKQSSKKHYDKHVLGTLGTMALLGMLGTMPVTAGVSPATQPTSLQQQKDVVKGHIVDENGDPLIGVTVRAANGAATVTDVDGNYELGVKPGTMLTLTYAGYKDAKVKAGGLTKMEPDVQGLNEVVVVGYGTVKKKDLTGAVTSMKNQDIVIAPTNNVMESLQGKVSGLDITKTSGEVGSGVNIVLRGNRSIYGDNSPLFIIDGLPGSYDQINPNDIESVDVLKDASATAIYGSAGANGVIIITTKRGKSGSTRVNFDAYYGWSGTPNFKHGMVGDEWTRYMREAYKYKNGDYPQNIEALMGGNQAYIDAYNNNKWIDWVDQASGNTATTQKYSLSVTGGTDKTKIYASTSYAHEKGLLSNEGQERYSLRLNLDQQIFSWAKVGFTSNLDYTRRDRGNSNTYNAALTAMPLGDVYNEDGKMNSEYIQNQYTPLGDFLDYQYANNTRTTYINAIGYLELQPVKGLTFRSQLDATLSNARLGQYWGQNATSKLPSYAKAPHASVTHNEAYNYTWENILSYNTTIAQDHNVGITGVTSWQKNTAEEYLAGGNDQMVDSWYWYRMISSTPVWLNSGYTRTQKMSYAVRLNYSYKGKYLATFSNRWDGVSFFSKGNKWASFPAGALAWRISDEAFMKGTKNWLDNLKLRLGAGITGNSGGVGAYATTTNVYQYSSAGVSVDGKYVPFVQYSGTYGSSNLSWEKSYNWNVGLDFGFLHGRIDGTIDAFSTKTKGLLFKRNMPITTGLTGWGWTLASWQNLAKTANKGVEFTINSRNIVTRNFTWSTTLTGTWQKEKIESLPEGDLINENLFEGQPIHAVYGYKYAGIWGTDASAEDLATYGVKPGWTKIETVPIIDKDGNSDEGKHKYSEKYDRQILGHENPNWILGLNNTFTYRGFDLTVYMMARLGQTFRSDLLGRYTAKSSITTNQIAGTDYWTENNQGAYYPAPGVGDDQSAGYNAFAYFDGSFLKIKNITLGYTLPQQLTRKVLIQKARVYFTAYNPWIICDSKLKHTDPEMGGNDAFPTYKQFVFGINITL
ncbi:MAG: TonB-dependent receptor [Prevotella sp.]|nr:TonB-dependent receptor [Prevotella sp.]MDY4625226.1 TonB-dependent receptor [Prevotella sp.]